MLDKKYNELDVVNKHIESKELEIDAIRSNFNHELNKLNTQQKYYEESFTDYEYQEKQFLDTSNLHKIEGEKIDERQRLFQEQIKKLCDEIENLEKETSEHKSNFKTKSDLLSTQNEIKSRIEQIQSAIEEIEYSQSNNQGQIQELDFAISKMESEIVTINLKIPNMEAEKKNYVQNKNFKV